MRAEDVIHVIHLKELFHHLRTEGVSRPSRAKAEFVSFRIRIRPYEIGHRAFVWDLAKAVDDFDLVEGVDRRAEAAVNAEDGVVDDDTEG